MHLHAFEMDVLEIVEALDHQELDPNLGTPNSLLYSLLSILFSFTFWLVVSFFSNVPSLLGKSHWNMLESWDQLEPPSAYFV